MFRKKKMSGKLFTEEDEKIINDSSPPNLSTGNNYGAANPITSISARNVDGEFLNY